jgi:mRNA-degrading endonuclease RelE of RelBE toxin-antitoxin system
MYTIELKSQPQRFIRDLPKKFQKQILDKIEVLKDDPAPANSEQLHSNPELRRLRSGCYRIIYHIQHDLHHVIVTKIGDRKDIYRSM